MLSMTGYGEGEAADERLRVHVELRAVNHRFLDLKVRVPEDQRAREGELAELLRRRLARGRVEARLRLQALVESPARVRVRKDALAALAAELASPELAGLAAGELSPGEALRLPGIVEIEIQGPEWDAAAARLLERAAGAAVDQLIQARRREGERLAVLIGEKLTEIEGLVERLEGRREEVREEIRERLERRLAELLGDASLPPERLAQEAALLVERSDIREELDRLSTHVAHFRELAARDGSIGKRLDFLSQELLRELNTTGSKCRDAAMAHDVIRGKLVCEQLREQIQNVE